MKGHRRNDENQGEVKATDDRVSETLVPSVQKKRRRDCDHEDGHELDPRDRMRRFPALSRAASGDEVLRPDRSEQQRPEPDDHAEAGDGEHAHVRLLA